MSGQDLTPWVTVTLDGDDVTCWTEKGLQLSWGRSSPTETTDAATCSLTLTQPPAQRPLGLLLTVAARHPVHGGETVVFRGQITDVATDGSSTALLAADLSATLGTLRLGDEPWPAETLGLRMLRLDQLLKATYPGTIAAQLITGWTAYDLPDVLLTARDVDSQPALQLLQEIAASVDAVLVYDPNTFYGPLGSLLMMPQRPLTANRDAVVGCELVDADLRWTLTTADMVNVLTVEYGTAAEDGGDRPVVHAMNQSGAADYGARAATLATQLDLQADAAALARQTVAALGAPSYALDGLSWIVSDTALPWPLWVATIARRLPGHSQIVAPSLEDPAVGRLYVVQGGSDVWDEDGWRATRTLADGAVGIAPVSWDDVPASATWDTVATGVRWDDVADVWEG